MIYPDTPLDEWKKRHKLTTESHECPGCKRSFELTVPIALQGMAGLTMADHGCGPNMPATLTPMSEKAKTFWRQVADVFHLT